jgi:hypothetical protein
MSPHRPVSRDRDSRIRIEVCAPVRNSIRAPCSSGPVVSALNASLRIFASQAFVELLQNRYRRRRCAPRAEPSSIGTGLADQRPRRRLARTCRVGEILGPRQRILNAITAGSSTTARRLVLPILVTTHLGCCHQRGECHHACHTPNTKAPRAAPSLLAVSKGLYRYHR